MKRPNINMRLMKLDRKVFKTYLVIFQFVEWFKSYVYSCDSYSKNSKRSSGIVFSTDKCFVFLSEGMFWKQAGKTSSFK